MEMDKRKRTCDGEEADTKRGKPPEDGGNDAAEGVVPPDQEVEEFFAILRRIQVAVKYFQKRKGGRELTATPWSPSFVREDFEGVKEAPEYPERNQKAGLDLNSDPASDEAEVTNSV
ncbi:hypothetical protein CDL12_22223 [Handroanthus impetiginosus]|uniref:Uncharacterized protein n=1 Tax=Handroanthus impetiginosus TaxID=429701 RepID=A0A2G9GIW6_9LAMI|nr:hypothetical protein CDL12_22223 [Handroanthus impetiginosus]